MIRGYARGAILGPQVPDEGVAAALLCLIEALEWLKHGHGTAFAIPEALRGWCWHWGGARYRAGQWSFRPQDVTATEEEYRAWLAAVRRTA